MKTILRFKPKEHVSIPKAVNEFLKANYEVKRVTVFDEKDLSLPYGSYSSMESLMHNWYYSKKDLNNTAYIAKVWKRYPKIKQMAYVTSSKVLIIYLKTEELR